MFVFRLLLLLFVLLVVRETKANEKCEKNVSAASLPVPAALLPVSLLLLPRVAKLSGDKKYENFDAATRFRFASKLFRSAQPVSVAAYYCVFVPTVAARCRSSTQRAAHSSHAHTPHSVRSLFVAALSLLGTGRAAASAATANHPSVLRARLHARNKTVCCAVLFAHSLTRSCLCCALSARSKWRRSQLICVCISISLVHCARVPF